VPKPAVYGDRGPVFLDFGCMRPMTRGRYNSGRQNFAEADGTSMEGRRKSIRACRA
jgi:hypothetical protein